MMNRPTQSNFPSIQLSHLELFVNDVALMERFYADALGFKVTDRSAGASGMVFLSRNPSEHHQIVLNPSASSAKYESPVDHISFRVESLVDLRLFYDALKSKTNSVQTVSHGNTWSVYFHDPEGNRLELFVETPWHVSQPCRFEIDLMSPDSDLYEFTESRIRDLPGFVARKDLDSTGYV